MRRLQSLLLTQLFLGIVTNIQKIQVCFFYSVLALNDLMSAEAKLGAALPDHIYLDAMGFGMGCCCLQLTFQACNIADARRLYDGLVPIGPILVSSIVHDLCHLIYDENLVSIDSCKSHMAGIPC